MTASDVVYIVEVLDALQDSEPIPRDRVMEWMKSENSDVIGAAIFLCSQEPALIEPNLTGADVKVMVFRTFEVAIRGRGEETTRFSLSCFDAARQLVDWARERLEASVYDESARPQLSEMAKFLEEKYRAGAPEVRECIVTGALEHLFEVLDLRGLFTDWETDTALSDAYAAARAWGDWAIKRRG